MSVSLPGGIVDTATQLEGLETYHQSPCFLPGGNHFLYLARTTFTNVRSGYDWICVSSLEDKVPRRLIQANSNAVYANGHILFVSPNLELSAVAFDLGTLSLKGEPVPIGKVKSNDIDGGGVFTASQNNVLAYQQPPASVGLRLMLYDRNGNEIRQVLGRASYMDVRFAPDGKRIAYSVSDSLERSLDIWIYDPSTPEPMRFAFGPFEERFPVWSRDGTEIVFTSDRTESGKRGPKEIYRKSVVSGAKEVLVPTMKQFIKQPWDFSPDGEYLAFVTSANEVNPKLRSDIYLLTLRGNHEIIPWAVTDANDWDSHFSPDGQWLAYCSEQTNQFEVFVSRVKGGSEQPISGSAGGERTGGRGPRWASGGKELFYLTLDNKLVVVQLRPAGPVMQILSRRTLFQTHAIGGACNYDVSPDGNRIIVITQEEEQISPPVMLVTNWTALVNKK